MVSLNDFLDRLKVENCIGGSNKNEISLFDLWKICLDSKKGLILHEKNEFGVWKTVEDLDCNISLFIEFGGIYFDNSQSTNFDEFHAFEQRLMQWKSNFIDAVNTRLCKLYDDINPVRTHNVNINILKFIHEKMSSINIECLASLSTQVHVFFQKNIISSMKLCGLFPYAPDRVRVGTLISIFNHSEAIKIYNQYLPQHLTVIKCIHISPDFLKTIEKERKSFTKASFAKLILSNIDDQARFDNCDLSFFINCDHLTLQQLAIEKQNFIPWIKFFSKVSRNCKFKDIHLLYREVMRIGYKSCVRNQKYIEALFSFFQSKVYQSNPTDLKYAISYSLIVNSADWSGACSGNVDRLINKLDCSIDEVRKTDVFRSFMKFAKSDCQYLKSGCRYGNLSTEFVYDLLVNCHILVGLEWCDTIKSDMGFVLQRVGDSYVLIGSDNQPERSFYHTIIVGDEVDIAMDSSHGYERYFDSVLKAHSV